SRSVAQVREALEDEFDAEVPEPGIRRFISRLERNYLLDVASYRVDDARTRKQILRQLRKRGLALRARARDGSSAEGRLFEEGTRKLNEGDPCEAARDFEAVLEINPDNERARQILASTHEAFFKT